MSLDDLLNRPAWHADAACRGMGPDLFFGDPLRAVEAKKVCAGCPVTAECLAAGMTEQRGVWGGTGWKARRRLLRAAA
jgi:WhiB family redox-sensing transcriptional regulator